LKNQLINKLTSLAKKNSYLPSKRATIRGLVAAIPWCGGSLDHLIFDKAEEIKTDNIIISINELKRKIELIEESKLDINWFSSKEGLQMFKELIEKIEFEPNKDKIEMLTNIYCVSGTKHFSEDRNKINILNKVSEITSIQKELLLLFYSLIPTTKEFKREGAFIQTSGTAIWIQQIADEINKNENEIFWTVELDLILEFEILSSLNLVRRLELVMSNKTGYLKTKLGEQVCNYLKG
jgi:hypothetical protein